MKGMVGEGMMAMMETTQAKLKEMGADVIFQNLKEQLKDLIWESVMVMKKTIPAKLKEVGMIHNPVEKFKELLLMGANFGLSLMAWLDKVFPPETRKERIQHWIQVGAPYVLPLLVLFVLIRFCRPGKGGKGGKMMKAPGKKNVRMARSPFEANPKGYFRRLHDREL